MQKAILVMLFHVLFPMVIMAAYMIFQVAVTLILSFALKPTQRLGIKFPKDDRFGFETAVLKQIVAIRRDTIMVFSVLFLIWYSFVMDYRETMASSFYENELLFAGVLAADLLIVPYLFLSTNVPVLLGYAIVVPWTITVNLITLFMVSQ